MEISGTQIVIGLVRVSCAANGNKKCQYLYSNIARKHMPRTLHPDVSSCKFTISISSEYYLKRLGCEKITPWVGICNSKRENNSIVEFETANPPEVFA